MRAGARVEGKVQGLANLVSTPGHADLFRHVATKLVDPAPNLLDPGDGVGIFTQVLERPQMTEVHCHPFAL